MFLVFIDESGKPTRGEKDPYVVAALILHDSVYLDLEREVDKVVESVLGEHIDIDAMKIEIHAKDIVQNKGVFRRVPVKARIRLLDELFSLMCERFKNKLTSIVIIIVKDKALSLDEKSARRRMVQRAYTLLVERITWFLEDYGKELALLMVDESDLDYDIRDIVRYELLHGLYTSRLGASRLIIDTPLFVKSHRYRPIQLADLIAYTYFRIHAGRPKAMGGAFDFMKYKGMIERILRRNKGGRMEGYGIKVWVE